MFFRLEDAATSIGVASSALATSLEALNGISVTGTFQEFQTRVGQQITALQTNNDSFEAVLSAMVAEADAALAVLSATASITTFEPRAGGLAPMNYAPHDSGFVPGPLTDIITQFKEIKKTVDDLKNLKKKVGIASDVLNLLLQNKSLDEVASGRSSFFSAISSVFKKMRADLDGSLEQILAGKVEGKQDDVDDFNDIVSFVKANDARLAELMSAPGFTIDSYRRLVLTDQQKDLIAQAFRSSTMRGRLYLRDNLLGFLNTLASAGVETYVGTIIKATGGGSVKSALEFAGKVYGFLTKGLDAPPPTTTLRFNVRRRFLRPDDSGSAVKADLFLLAKLPDGNTRLATFLVSGKNVINEAGDILLTDGLQVPALTYAILVVPRDQQDEPVKLLPFATVIDANLTTFVDLGIVSATKLTLNFHAYQKDTTGNLIDAQLTFDQIKLFSVHVEGFPQSADGPMGAIFDSAVRPDGTAQGFYVIPFLPPDLPLTIKVSGPDIETASKTFTVTKPEQELAVPVTLLAPVARVPDYWPKVSWKLTSYDGNLVASGTGTNFSAVLTNLTYVSWTMRTSVVANVTASISVTPIFSGEPFDVTLTVSGTAQGAVPVAISSWANAPYQTQLPLTPLPSTLTLKAAFRPLQPGSNLYKADFIGSAPFVGHGTKTFLSADVPYEGFAGNFYLQAGVGTISFANGVIGFGGNIVFGDLNISANYTPLTLKATVLTWPTGFP